MSKKARRLCREYVGNKTEDIHYSGIRQEINMAAIHTEETRRKAQQELVELNYLREYVKMVEEFQKRERTTWSIFWMLKCARQKRN